MRREWKVNSTGEGFDAIRKFRYELQHTRLELLRLLSTAVAGSIRANVEIIATGQEASNGTNLSVEIKNHRLEYTKEQCQQIEDLCLEEELVRILEAG